MPFAYDIECLLPTLGVGYTLPLMCSDQEPAAVACFFANLSCIVFDYVARQKIGGTHMNYFVVKQLPVLPPTTYSATDIGFIVPRVIELTYTALDIAGFAHDLGYAGPPFAWDPARRAVLQAEVDAYYARLYGLSRDEVRYILDPSDIRGPEYPSETFRVLKEREMGEYGEYRTRRLVLEAWDRLEAGEIISRSSDSVRSAPAR